MSDASTVHDVFYPIAVGDTVIDCVPRSAGRARKVLRVLDDRVVVGIPGWTPGTRISRSQLHRDLKKQSGYYIMPNGDPQPPVEDDA